MENMANASQKYRTGWLPSRRHNNVDSRTSSSPINATDGREDTIDGRGDSLILIKRSTAVQSQRQATAMGQATGVGETDLARGTTVGSE